MANKSFRRIPGYIQSNPDSIFQNKRALKEEKEDEPASKRPRLE